MRGLLWNLLLALAYVAVAGEFSAGNLLLGFILGFAILAILRPVFGFGDYGRKAIKALALCAFFIRELIRANVRVAYDVLTPRHHMRPGVVAIPLDARTDTQITLLANLITMTPGTLSLDVSPDRGTLYVHTLYLDDVDAFRREIKDGFERRVLEVLG